MSKKNIVLMGAGAVGKVIIQAMVAHNRSEQTHSLKPIAFVDIDPLKIGRKVCGIDVISLEEVKKIAKKDLYFITTVGSSLMRQNIVKGLKGLLPDAKFITIIHPSAVIMEGAKISQGVYVGANTTISIECNIGPHSMLNYNVVMGHNSSLGEYSVISPLCHIAGYVKIGDRVFLGGGVMTYPGIKIGNGCMIGAGCVVPRDVPDNQKVVLKPNTMILPVK